MSSARSTTPVFGEFAVEPLGDTALLLRFGRTMNRETSARVHTAARMARKLSLHGVIDLIPAFTTLTLVFDGAFDAPQARAIETRVRAALGDATVDAEVSGRRFEIPVAYGGADGPDLEELAAHASMDAAEVVRRHTGVEYVVAMIGFMPGFPYLLGLDPALAMPRRASPRTRVSAGSVAIGGAQTGIYPTASPGGWQLLGRTNAVLFDPAQEPPALLEPGDRVRFVSIPAAAFKASRVEVAHA